MNAAMSVDEARSGYAEWFVKHHYLKRREPWTGGRHAWQMCQERGYIRYYTKDGYGDQEFDEFDTWRSSFDAMLSTKEDEKHWFRINLEDLDDPINDHHSIVRSYRMYRQQQENWERWSWLMAEAEHRLLTYEAWLRAYNADPSEFPSGWAS